MIYGPAGLCTSHCIDNVYRIDLHTRKLMHSDARFTVIRKAFSVHCDHLIPAVFTSSVFGDIEIGNVRLLSNSTLRLLTF